MEFLFSLLAKVLGKYVNFLTKKRTKLVCHSLLMLIDENYSITNWIFLVLSHALYVSSLAIIFRQSTDFKI